MDLRIPSGGGGLLASLWAAGDAGDGRFLDEDDAAIVPDVAAPQVEDALGQLFAGNLEYVGLNAHDAWIQTAEVPGGYVVERSERDDPVVAYPLTLSAEQVLDAFLAFVAGDLAAGLDWSDV